jgi:hypothetical protein
VLYVTLEKTGAWPAVVVEEEQEFAARGATSMRPGSSRRPRRAVSDTGSGSSGRTGMTIDKTGRSDEPVVELSADIAPLDISGSDRLGDRPRVSSRDPESLSIFMVRSNRALRGEFALMDSEGRRAGHLPS